MRRLFLIIPVIIFGIVVGVGIWLAGTPGEARIKRFDMVRVNNLQEIDFAVSNYYQRANRLPDSLNLLRTDSPYLVINDPESGAEYGYRVAGTSTTQYELCAQFTTAEENTNGEYYYPPSHPSWLHPAGNHCFKRTAFDTDVSKPMYR